jgi:hypothetical protein
MCYKVDRSDKALRGRSVLQGSAIEEGVGPPELPRALYGVRCSPRWITAYPTGLASVPWTHTRVSQRSTTCPSLSYVGFSQMDLSTARSVVLALGIVYLVVGILGFVVPMMFGLIPHGYTIFDDLLHLVLGGLSLAVAFAAPRGTTQTRRSANV